MNIDHQESLEAEVVRLREELAESRRHADGMARAPYGEFEAMREERDRLARRVAELEAEMDAELIGHAQDARDAQAEQLREQAAKSPWSFHQGTLRERLEWCRVQHQLAAEKPPLYPPTREAKADFDRACVEWYREMVEQLDAIEAKRDALAEQIADDGLGERLVNGVLFSDHVKQWFVSNQKSPGDVLHGRFPLGMVATWIDRAERAERRIAELEAALGAYDVAFGEWAKLVEMTLSRKACEQWQSIARAALAGDGGGA